MLYSKLKKMFEKVIKKKNKFFFVKIVKAVEGFFSFLKSNCKERPI